MRNFRRAAIIFILITLALSSLAHAVCGPGHESCEPSADEARARVDQLLNSAFLTPYSIVRLDNLDARGVETQGHKIYEMRFSAVLTFSGDKLRCRKIFAPNCKTIWWKSMRPERKQQSRAGYFLNKRNKDGARARFLTSAIDRKAGVCATTAGERYASGGAWVL